MIYQLIRAGKCKETDANGKNDPPFDRRTTPWFTGKNTELYYNILQFYANSSFWITVRSRKHFDNKFIYGQYDNGIISTTPESKYYGYNL